MSLWECRTCIDQFFTGVRCPLGHNPTPEQREAQAAEGFWRNTGVLDKLDDALAMWRLQGADPAVSQDFIEGVERRLSEPRPPLLGPSAAGGAPPCPAVPAEPEYAF